MRLGEDERPADDIGMAAEVLGRGVHDDVGAEGERLLQRRGGEGVVDHDSASASRPRAARPAMSVMRSSGFDGVSTHSNRGARPETAARTASASLMSTCAGARPRAPARGRAADRCPRRRRCRAAPRRQATAPHAAACPRRRVRREREGVRSALDRGELFLQGGARRVAAAAVLVSLPQAADAVLGICRGEVDGRDDRPGRGVGLLAGVDGEAREPAGGVGGHRCAPVVGISVSVRVAKPRASSHASSYSLLR